MIGGRGRKEWKKHYVCGMRDVYSQEDNQIFEEVWTSSFVFKKKSWMEGGKRNKGKLEE